MIQGFRKLKKHINIFSLLILFICIGNLNISASNKANLASYLKADTNINIQTIDSFPTRDTAIFGQADYNPGAVASSGLLVTYSSSDTTIVSIVDNKIHLKKIGIDTITAAQSGDSNIMAVTAKQILVIVRATFQNFDSTSTVTFGIADYNPGATTSLGLPITYSSSDTNVVSIVNNKIHLKKIGTDTIIASLIGDSDIILATSKQFLTIIRATIQKFDSLSTVTYGKADYDPGATDALEFPIIYSSSDTNIVSIVNNKIHLKNIGTDTITASLLGDSDIVLATAKQILLINKAQLYALGQTETIECGKTVKLDTSNISFVGLVSKDESYSIRKQLSVSTTGTNVMGKFPITVSGPSYYGNYNITYISGILTIKYIGPISEIVNLCNGDSMSLPNDSIVRTSGTYLYTTTQNKGCDTVMSYSVNIVSPDSITIDSVKCTGDSMKIGNVYIKTAGVYKDTISRVNGGCDSLYRTISLSFEGAASVDAGVDQEICKGDSIILAATGSGNFTWQGYADTVIKVSPTKDTILTAVSTTACGTAIGKITVKVDTKPSKPGIYLNSVTFSTDINTSLYGVQWFESTYGIIKSATEWEYVPKMSGSYFVMAKNGTCYSTSSDTIPYVYTTVTSSLTSSSNDLVIYPNPIENGLKISLGSGITKIEIYNTIGNKVLLKNLASETSVQIDASTWKQGVYLIKVWPTNTSLSPIVKTIIKK